MRINNIIEAIGGDKLFKPFLGDLDSLQAWLTALQVLYGLDMKPTKDKANLIRLCTGWERKPQFAPGGFKTALFLIGRRGREVTCHFHCWSIRGHLGRTS